MKNIFVSTLAISFFLIFSPAMAQVSESVEVVEEVVLPVGAPAEPEVAEPVVSAPVSGEPDLPKILPGSATYFLKEFVRGVERLVTFNPVRRAELELKISSEKAEEIKALEASGKASDEALRRAVNNYETNAVRLKTRLDALRQTSENPNIDRLLRNVSERVLEHESVLNEIVAKRPSVAFAEEEVRRAHEDIIVSSAAKFASPEEFGQRLKEAIVVRDGRDDTEIRALSLINRIEEKTPRDAVAELRRVKEEVASRLSARADLDQNLANRVSEMVRTIPSPELRLKVASDLLSYGDQNLKNKIEATEKSLGEGAGISPERAQSAVEAARRVVANLSSAVSAETLAGTPSGFREAESHLSEAEKALADGNYGLAYGRATAAGTIAENALRRLTSGGEELNRAISSIGREYDRILSFVSERGLAAEKNPEIFSRIEAVGLMVKSADSFDSVTAARKSLVELESAIRRLLSGVSPVQTRACPQVYLPVCGEDGKTYGNACEAGVGNVRVVKAGECESSGTTSERLPSPVKREVACTMEYNPVCGEDGKTYGNSCFAETAGVRIRHRGQCEVIKPESNTEARPSGSVIPVRPLIPIPVKPNGVNTQGTIEARPETSGNLRPGSADTNPATMERPSTIAPFSVSPSESVEKTTE